MSDAHYDDFDSPWKEALERFLEPFFAFFLPEAHADIDWSEPAEHLDAELRKVVRDAEATNQRADFLIRVRLKEGEERWVLIHIEVQSQVDMDLARRLFTYDYRIFDRYQVPVATLALLGETRAGWQPDRYGWDLWGAGLEARFRIYQMLDWRDREAELIADPNPFALVVLAHLRTRATRGKAAQRRKWKLELLRLLHEKLFSEEETRELFRILDWMMRLPKAEEELFKVEYDQMTKEMGMRYVTSIERLAKEEGHEQGLVQGREQGLAQGLVQGREEGFREARRQMLLVIEKLFSSRFGDLPEWARERLRQGSPQELEMWSERLFDAGSLEAVFAEPS